jgi:hypothetical protein
MGDAHSEPHIHRGILAAVSSLVLRGRRRILLGTVGLVQELPNLGVSIRDMRQTVR